MALLAKTKNIYILRDYKNNQGAVQLQFNAI